MLTAADHMLVLRLARELWIRLPWRRPGQDGEGGGGVRRWRWRRLRQLWAAVRWLLLDGFASSGWGFR